LSPLGHDGGAPLGVPRSGPGGPAPPALAPPNPLAPPRDLAELLARARALEGRSLDELAAELGFLLGGAGLHAKGRAGELVERALGASAGSAAEPDFPHLGVELKTVPVDGGGRPRESTFVCAFALADADRAEWRSSWARRKLACVLWVPIVMGPEGRRIGSPALWQPTPAQEAVLAADFDDIMGKVGAGRIEDLDARTGRWLQARPKAAHGRVRTVAFDPEGEPIAALPRGLYLRARFTGALLRDPGAVPA
jgi:DNA mismatch repair protein MutH